MVIDPEDGRDRTPKPLVAARPHGGAQPDEAWGSSEAGGAADSGGRASSLSFGPALPGIPSAHSLLAGDLDGAMLDGGTSQDSPPAPPGVRSGRQSMLHHAAAGAAGAGDGGAQRATPAGDGTQRSTHSGGRATPLAAGLMELDKASALPAEQREQREQAGRRKHLRSQAVQCAAVPSTSRGVQVLPWELHATAAVQDAAAEAAAAAISGTAGRAAGEADAAAAEGVGEEEEEALAAMAQQQSVADMRGRGFESHRFSPLGSHRGLTSFSPSRRGSVAGAVGRGGVSIEGCCVQQGSASCAADSQVCLARGSSSYFGGLFCRHLLFPCPTCSCRQHQLTAHHNEHIHRPVGRRRPRVAEQRSG